MPKITLYHTLHFYSKGQTVLSRLLTASLEDAISTAVRMVEQEKGTPVNITGSNGMILDENQLRSEIKRRIQKI
ncbi:hypothetical protein [Leptospirillum ferriphilum]|uniref:hypothetical protein n=1 Tax=Leptospirillum ferriphilum TaxID=178606 RepID=UPI00117ACC6B|nr:hypothetical protein [Leptospirillum ferriphilum]